MRRAPGSRELVPGHPSERYCDKPGFPNIAQAEAGVVYTVLIKLDLTTSNMTTAETSVTAFLETGLNRSAIKAELAGAVPIDAQG